MTEGRTFGLGRRRPVGRTDGCFSHLGRKHFPMGFGDDLDGSIDHFDCGLTVNRVRAVTVFSGSISWSRCGKIEKSTTPCVRPTPVGGCQPTKHSPMRGALPWLPALIPAQTVSRREGKRSRAGLTHPMAQIPGVAHGAGGFSSTDQAPCMGRSDLGVALSRRGNTEGVGFGNRLAQDVDQRVVNAGVFDADRGEEGARWPGL